MSTYDYDLFVIGAGSGGVRAARIAAGYGARVAVAEEYRVGGTCVIRGCVPKKLFVYASKYKSDFKDAAGFGWTVNQPSFDWATLLGNKDTEIARLNGIYIRNLENSGVEIVNSRAVIEGPNAVRLVNENRTVTAERILIAVGATPKLDGSVPGIEHAITSNEAFHMDTVPETAIVVGGGYIAVEFAGILNGLGAKTTLLYRGEEILRGFDDDLRTHLHQEMEKKGITVMTGDNIAELDKTTGGISARTVNGKALVADQVLYAIGRIPYVEGLGLETAGVETDRSGAIKVDEHSKTNVDSIYAVGDVTNRAQLTPVAIREGHAFADTIYGGKEVIVDHSCIPTAVFSQPEIGTVGLTESEARAQHRIVDVYKSTFRPMKHTLSGGEEKTMMKILVDGETDRVLGVHIIGPDAGEMVQILGITLKMGATKADFDATIAVHPTASEELVTMRQRTERHVRDN